MFNAEPCVSLLWRVIPEEAFFRYFIATTFILILASCPIWTTSTERLKYPELTTDMCCIHPIDILHSDQTTMTPFSSSWLVKCIPRKLCRWSKLLLKRITSWRDTESVSPMQLSPLQLIGMTQTVAKTSWRKILSPSKTICFRETFADFSISYTIELSPFCQLDILISTRPCTDVKFFWRGFYFLVGETWCSRWDIMTNSPCLPKLSSFHWDSRRSGRYHTKGTLLWRGSFLSAWLSFIAQTLHWGPHFLSSCSLYCQRDITSWGDIPAKSLSHTEGFLCVDKTPTEDNHIETPSLPFGETSL